MCIITTTRISTQDLLLIHVHGSNVKSYNLNEDAYHEDTNKPCWIAKLNI